MNHSFLLPPPNRLNQPFDGGTEGGGGAMSSMTRRKFLKRSGGATVATIIALNMGIERALGAGAHSPATCSHLVQGTPAGSPVKSTGVSLSDCTVKAVYDSIPTSGLGKTVTVRCQIELTKSNLIFPDEVVYGAALSLTGTLGPGCVFESSFPDTADSFEIAALQSTDADWLFKYFAVL
jgi:hypothetical protein